MKNRENRPKKKGKAVAFWGCLALAAVISGGNVKGTVYAAEAAVVEAIYDADETGEYGGLFYGDGESVPGSEGQNDGEGKGNSSAGVNSGNGEGIALCGDAPTAPKKDR